MLGRRIQRQAPDWYGLVNKKIKGTDRRFGFVPSISNQTASSNAAGLLQNDLIAFLQASKKFRLRAI